jgi:hypothetical protein
MCAANKPGNAEPAVFIDNERVRVTEWRFKKKGDNTGWHRHGYDYVMVPLFDGQLEIDHGGGKRTLAPMKNGIPYFRNEGIEHDVINGSEFECAFVDIELLK